MSAYEQFLQKYGPAAGERAPEKLVEEVLGAEPDDWQREVLREFGRGTRLISIRSCHGPGKTTVLAWMVWTMLLTRFPQKTVATAPSVGQLEDALVAEILKWGQSLPPALQELYEFKKNRIELKAAPSKSFFSARTAREEKPEALQGVHEDHVLLIVDEASGVPEKIFEAGAGSMSSEHAQTILTSNPTRSTGFFWETHNTLKHMWKTFHISWKDSPRVTEEFAYDMEQRYGASSNQFRVRALGEFPLGDEDTVIPVDLIQTAQERDITMPPGLREVWGLDVARFGADSNVLLARNKLGVLPDIEEWRGKDLMATTGRVKAKWDGLRPDQRPDEILVDVIGLGAGVVDRLQELKLPARGINVSEQASVVEKYMNLRTELWFMALDWLRARSRSLPKGEGDKDDLRDKLAVELAAVRYGFTSSGKLRVEPKEETKKTIRRSPNVADAFILTFASEPATLLHGSGSERGWTRDWGEPIKRGLAIV